MLTFSFVGVSDFMCFFCVLWKRKENRPFPGKGKDKNGAKKPRQNDMYPLTWTQ